MISRSSDWDSFRVRFDRDGYIALPQFVSRDELAEIEENVRRFIDEVLHCLPRDEVFYEHKDDPTTLKQIQRMHVHDEYFSDLMNDSPFRRVAEVLLGDNVVPQNMQYFNKPPGVGQPTPPHQDGFYFMLEPCEAVTMWFGLDDADEENGCVRYIAGSHKAGMRPHGKSGTLGFSQSIVDYDDNDQQQELPIITRPGDLIVHHALTIHSASGNELATRNRRSLGFIYYAERAIVDEAAHGVYRERLAIELAAAGKI